MLISGGMQLKGKNKASLVEIMNDMFNMPKTMLQLASVQFFSWFALFAMWIYTTAAVTSTTYDMKLYPNNVKVFTNIIDNTDFSSANIDMNRIDEIKQDLRGYYKKIQTGSSYVIPSLRVIKFFSDTSNQAVLKKLTAPQLSRVQYIQKQYNTGADWVGILFAVFAAIVAWFLTPFAKATSRKSAHAISLLLGGLGLFSIYFIHDQYLLIISMLGVGVAWASILSIPYAILTNALPHDKMGIYMGIFNYFIVIPQIVAAAILGFFLQKFFHSEAIYALIIGGISMFLASVLILFVKDEN